MYIAQHLFCQFTFCRLENQKCDYEYLTDIVYMEMFENLFKPSHILSQIGIFRNSILYT